MATDTDTWIVNFHGVGQIVRPYDPGEETVWLKEQEFLTILDGLKEQKGIAITFDDGNASDVEIALPALQCRGMNATFFIAVGKLGEKGYLQKSDLKTLVGAGMTIGSHGWSHKSWRNLPVGEAQQEIIESMKQLEDITGVKVDSAACPFGDYDRQVLRALIKAGYRSVYTSDRGPAKASCHLKPRNTVHASDTSDGILSERLNFQNGLVRRCRLFYKRIR